MPISEQRLKYKYTKRSANIGTKRRSTKRTPISEEQRQCQLLINKDSTDFRTKTVPISQQRDNANIIRSTKTVPTWDQQRQCQYQINKDNADCHQINKDYANIRSTKTALTEMRSTKSVPRSDQPEQHALIDIRSTKTMPISDQQRQCQYQINKDSTD